MKITQARRVLKQFKQFLEIELMPLGLTIKLYKNSRKKTHFFRATQDQKVVVQVPIDSKDLFDPNTKHLNITLQIGKGVDKDRKLLANSAAGVAAYLKIYKDLLDGQSNDLDYYETYFKLARQKWLGEVKN